MQGVPVPSGLRETENPGGGNLLFHAISQGLVQCAMKAARNMIKAKVVTTKRKKPQEHENEVRQRLATSHFRKLRHLRGVLGGAYGGRSMVLGTRGVGGRRNLQGLGGCVHQGINVRHQSKQTQRYHFLEVPRETFGQLCFGKTCRRKLQRPRTCQP